MVQRLNAGEVNHPIRIWEFVLQDDAIDAEAGAGEVLSGEASALRKVMKRGSRTSDPSVPGNARAEPRRIS